MVMNKPANFEVDRHKAAIVRSDLSRPVKTAIESGLFVESTSFFDYGCGHGGDIDRVSSMGFSSKGWDPYFRPNAEKQSAHIVNLGYVLNVIENASERRQALVEAWSLTHKVLIVSAQVMLDYLGDNVISFGDGVITKRNTFQKVFRQEELKEYIDSNLGVNSVPAGLGIYFVFKNEQDAETFRASRFHSRRSSPQIRLRTKSFDECQELLKPLIDFVTDRGRLPLRGEFAHEEQIKKELGSIGRAFKLIVDATSKTEWDELIEKRKQDLLLYIALSKFGKRPRIGLLSHEIQNDIKALFGSYKVACDQADEMLFSLGQEGIIAKTCNASKIGKYVPDGLYVHISAMDELDLILRLYEGCASRTVGRMNDTTLVKFHTQKPVISYLFYPEFDSDPHPALHTSVRIDLRDLHLKYSEYAESENPPILHRKETFVSTSYPLYEKFAQLTKEEEALGLLSDASRIGNRKAWADRLKANNVILEDHSVKVQPAG